MYIDRSVSVAIMCVIVVVIVLSVSITSARKHADEIANLRELVAAGSNGDKQPSNDESSSLASSLPGGWYSNWDVIDQTIRRPRRGALSPTQMYYTPTYENRGGAAERATDRYVQNSRGTGNPMITSVKTPLPLGVWARIGTAYTTNPSDSTVVYLYQKTLDPDRDFYQYKVVNENGFEIPLDSGITELKNGMTFNVPGWESKGPFTANITSGGYSFVYV